MQIYIKKVRYPNAPTIFKKFTLILFTLFLYKTINLFKKNFLKYFIKMHHFKVNKIIKIIYFYEILKINNFENIFNFVLKRYIFKGN